MDASSLRNLIGDVFGPSYTTKEINGWLSMRCPLAQWTHDRGADRRPSAGISIQPNNTSVFNCLRGDTLVRTLQGTRAIRELAGTTQTLQMPDGTWEDHPVRSFGVQPLYLIKLSRNGRTREVYATEGHRWFAQSQGGGRHLERLTTDLTPGLRMQSVALIAPTLDDPSPEGVLHGAVFGDGAIHVNRRHARLNLYGEKAQLFPALRAISTNSGTTPDGVPYVSGAYAYMKWVPRDAPRDYLAGFVAGLIATDGCVDAAGNVSVSSASLSTLEWVRDTCYTLGVESFGITRTDRVGYGVEETPLYNLSLVSRTVPDSLLLRTDQLSRKVSGSSRGYTRWQWQVVSVEPAGFSEEVFCATVAGHAAFVLDGGLVTGNCMTCHTKLPLQALVAQYAEYTGEDLSALVDELEDEAYLGPRSMPDWDVMREKGAIVQEPLNAKIVLDLYDSAAGHPYLRKRGISRRTAELLQLKLDPSDPADGEERILFPTFGPEGELYGMSGRATHKDAYLKVRDYSGFKKAYNLLGAHLITQTKPDKVIVVEGLMDYAAAWECGQPGVAAMHSTLTSHQADILRGFALPTYLFYDNPEIDTAGADGVRIAAEALVAYMPVMRVRYPKTWIDDPDEEGGGHWLKDPGDLTREEFVEMIRDARLC